MAADKSLIMEELAKASARRSALNLVPDVPDVPEDDDDGAYIPDVDDAEVEGIDLTDYLPDDTEAVAEGAEDAEDGPDGLPSDITEDGPAEAPVGLAPGELETLRAEAARGQTLATFINDHPEEAVRLMLKNLTDAQKASLQEVAKAPDALGEISLDVDYSELSSAEKLAYDTLASKDAREFLRSGRQTLETYAEKTAEALNKTNAAVQQSVLERDYHTARIELVLEHLASAMGLVIPPEDLESVNALLAKGVTIKDAVRQSKYGKGLEELGKKIKSKSPETPQQRSNGSKRPQVRRDLAGILLEEKARLDAAMRNGGVRRRG